MQMQTPTPLKWIGFDLDGTLVHTAIDIHSALNTMLAFYKQTAVKLSDVETWIGNGIDKVTERALLKVNAHSVDLNDAINHVNIIYNQCVANQSTLYSNALDTLSILKDHGLKLLLVTNKNEQHTHSLINTLNIAHFFDTVVCGDSLPQRKPDPAMLLSAINKLDLKIDEGIYIGDSINDIATARNSGCPVICVDYGYNHGNQIAESRPDKVISDLKQVIEVIELPRLTKSLL